MTFHDAVLSKSRNSWKPVTIQQSIKVMHVKNFIAIQIENTTTNIKSLVPIEDFANAVMDVINNVVMDVPIRSALYDQGDDRVTIVRNISNNKDFNELKGAKSKSKRAYLKRNLKYQIVIKNATDEIVYNLNRQSFVRLVRYTISEFIGVRGFE